MLTFFSFQILSVKITVWDSAFAVETLFKSNESVIATQRAFGADSKLILP